MKTDFGFFAVHALPGYGPVVVRAAAVVVVPVGRDGRLWLLRIHRPPTGEESWELPGGGVEPREAPQQAARRELAEECHLQGGTARLWERPLEPAPGMARFPHHVVRINQVVPLPGGPRPQRSEGVREVRAFTPAQVRRLVRAQQIRAQPTLSALLLTRVLE